MVATSLAQMVEARRTRIRDAAAAAARAAIVVLPAAVWREIEGRASSVGIEAELLDDGSRLRLVADIPPLDAIPDPSAPSS